MALDEPALFEAVSLTVYVPARVNTWVGRGEVDGDEPSPKFHDQVVGAGVDVSAKATLKGAVPEEGDMVNDTFGAEPPLNSST